MDRLQAEQQQQQAGDHKNNKKRKRTGYVEIKKDYSGDIVDTSQLEGFHKLRQEEVEAKKRTFKLRRKEKKGGTTNKQKRKTKAFIMYRKSDAVRSKAMRTQKEINRRKKIVEKRQHKFKVRFG
eukprot:GEZU01006397.1.p3 GENE.GEZU01006397.1~~GEZU01006397.1.p3  ORF type:complete len:124 (-),score=81.90 GEZU01006397.1:108-479(-)